MNDPAHTTMSWTAVLVLTVVALVLVIGWLAAVFYAGRQTGSGSARPDAADPGHARQPETDALGEVPAERAG